VSNFLKLENCDRVLRKHPTARVGLFVAALAACSLALLAAQAPNSSSPAPTQAASPSVISVQTNLVLVRVVVRDGHGNAVTGLSQTDFQLFDNGKPQTIAYFSTENAAAPPAPAPTLSTQQAGAPSANSPTSTQRYTALFFDDYHLQIQSLDQTRKAAQAFVTKALNIGDRVGIFTASGQVTLDFTTDAGKLQKALSGLRIATNIAAETSGSAQDCTALKDYIAQGVMDNDPDAIAIAGTGPNNACAATTKARHYNVLSFRRFLELRRRTRNMIWPKAMHPPKPRLQRCRNLSGISANFPANTGSAWCRTVS